MSVDLTTAEIDRQNILNNSYALTEVEKVAGIQGISFEGRTVLLKEQVASFFEVTTWTVDNYLEKSGEELKKNGYALLKGRSLKSSKLAIQSLVVHETDFVNISKATGVIPLRHLGPSLRILWSLFSISCSTNVFVTQGGYTKKIRPIS